MDYAEIERKYKKTVSTEHRKAYAQFFTPEPVAELMAGWLLGVPSLANVLDPAFGLGILGKAVSKRKAVHVKGYETDEMIMDFAHKNCPISDTHLCHQDYMLSDWDERYDGIICNPPYFKFHDYDNKLYIREVEKHLKCKLSGFTNLYTLFLLKSIHQLNPGGRCAYIVPSEFLNSDYGVQIKELLLLSGTLRHVIVIDFTENLFDDALTTACIILCANDDEDKEVRFSYVKTLEGLLKAYKNYTVIDKDELESKVKWKSYYAGRSHLRYKHLVPFAKYARVMRGIATGDNNYFAFSESKARKYKLTEKHMIQCVCKSADVQSTIFTADQFEQLRQKDKKVFLFNGNANPKNESVKEYIKIGEDTKVNERYLTSQRTPWYALEKRPPAPIWVTVFNRHGLRFVRNEAHVHNLTTFHCVYPVRQTLFEGIDDDVLFAYLQTDLAKNILLENSREYGNGLIKFEPNDINKGMMADLEMMEPGKKRKVKELYVKYRQTRNRARLDEIESLFQQEYMMQ